VRIIVVVVVVVDFLSSFWAAHGYKTGIKLVLNENSKIQLQPSLFRSYSLLPGHYYITHFHFFTREQERRVRSSAQHLLVKLTDVNYSKKFNYNLFSAARCLKNGWTMTGDKECITLVHPSGGHKLVFDIVIPTKNGALFATMLTKDTEVANAQVEKPQAMTLKQAHSKLGHYCDIEKTRHTAKRLNWKQVMV
jgi:hypothetical protein